MSLRLRRLSRAEIRAIRELAARRVEQRTEYRKGKDVWRPWEVALFAQCASQDPKLRDAVVDPHGLPSLIAALDFMLADQVWVREVNWEHVALTLRSLAFLSEQAWVAHAIEPAIVKSLLRVFKRSIPERWFCIRFWAADTIRNLVANRPELARTLIQQNAVSAFETLTNPQIDHELTADPSQLERRRREVRQTAPLPITPAVPTSPTANSSPPIFQSPQRSPQLLPPLSPADEPRPSSSTSSTYSPVTPSSGIGEHLFPSSFMAPHLAGRADRRASTSSSSRDTITQLSGRVTPRRPPSLIPTPAQERLLDAYKVEATKRAAELSAYLNQWTEWTPNKLPVVEAPRLEVVGAGVGWLPDFAAAGWASDAQ
ncbi:hypothetical protein JB92DRAFT_2911102 [Gautieria morchelliformis]|nr:hypothetical protein JB92DRAFT_2911102 [Gautieria morchelliformis]